MRWKQHQVIGALGLRVGNGAAQGVRTKLNVGIGEKQPFSARLLRRQPHRVLLAHPSRGQFAHVQHAQTRRASLLRRDPLHQLARVVGRSVVDCDYFVIGIFEFLQRCQPAHHRIAFISGWNDDAEPGRGRRYAVPLGGGDVGDRRHAAPAIAQALPPEPRHQQSEEPPGRDHVAGSVTRTGGANFAP